MSTNFNPYEFLPPAFSVEYYGLFSDYMENPTFPGDLETSSKYKNTILQPCKKKKEYHPPSQII